MRKFFQSLANSKSVQSQPTKPMRIELFQVPGDPNNEIVRKALNNLPEIILIEVNCPRLMPPVFLMPYIKTESHEAVFGVDDICDYIQNTNCTSGK